MSLTQTISLEEVQKKTIEGDNMPKIAVFLMFCLMMISCDASPVKIDAAKISSSNVREIIETKLTPIRIVKKELFTYFQPFGKTAATIYAFADNDIVFETKEGILLAVNEKSSVIIGKSYEVVGPLWQVDKERDGKYLVLYLRRVK